MAAQGKKDELTWMHVIVRVFLNSTTHPIEYAKVLIQVWVGHTCHVSYGRHIRPIRGLVVDTGEQSADRIGFFGGSRLYVVKIYILSVIHIVLSILPHYQ